MGSQIRQVPTTGPQRTAEDNAKTRRRLNQAERRIGRLSRLQSIEQIEDWTETLRDAALSYTCSDLVIEVPEHTPYVLLAPVVTFDRETGSGTNWSMYIDCDVDYTDHYNSSGNPTNIMRVGYGSFQLAGVIQTWRGGDVGTGGAYDLHSYTSFIGVEPGTRTFNLRLVRGPGTYATVNMYERILRAGVV
jgi:hypothetical protein